MDFNDTKNIFLQIRDWVADQILQDKIRAGEKIPSVRELAVDMEVNRNTVMRSYSLMEAEGIVENKRGIGFFVAADGTVQAAVPPLARLLKAVKNCSAVFLATPSIRRAPTCASLPPMLALTL